MCFEATRPLLSRAEEAKITIGPHVPVLLSFAELLKLGGNISFSVIVY